MYGVGERGAWENIDSSGGNSKYQEFKHRRDKERDTEAEKKVDEQSHEATERYNNDPVVQTARTKIQDAQATRPEGEAAEVEEAENAHVDDVFQERARAAEEARIKSIREKADAEAKARANKETVDPFQNSDYVAPTEDEVSERKEQQIKDRDEYNDQVYQEEQERKAAEEERRKAEEEARFYEENDPNKEGTLDPKGQSARDWEERQRKKIEEGREGMGPGENLDDMTERQQRERRQEEYNAMVNSDDPNVRLKTVEGLVNERNDLAKQHMMKMANAIAQTAAEMGGQMASKGWDLAGNIVKMTFTQPHAMSSSSRLIGTAMSAVQTAGDFADRSMEKYKIDANADPNLMKNTIRYKLYKREAQMGKNTVGNTFRAISESLGNMGLQDASQMTPDQLEQHVADMQAEADRLIQASKDPKLSAMERSLIKAQADHLQGYMAGLGKQGATMAQNQRIAARRQRRQDLATRRQNYQILADGSPNPYREALQWADPRFGIEVDPQTGRPINPSAYRRMLNAVIAQHQNEVAAAPNHQLDPARERWFNDLQNMIHNDIQAMNQDRAENPLRGRAEIYARIGRVAPGFERYIDNIERTGTFPSNSTQSSRAIRKVLADYLFELESEDKQGTPEYNHARALLTAMDKYNNMKKLMSRIAGVMPHGAERAKRIHEATENDPYVKEDFSDNGKIKDYTKLVEAYAHLMEHLPRDPVKGGNFNPEDKEYQHYEGIFNDNLTYFVNKWFPGAGWSAGGNDEDADEGGDEGGTPGGGTPGGGGGRVLEDFFNDDEGEDEGGTPGGGTPGGESPETIDPTPDETDQFISEVLNELRRMGGYSDDAEAEEEAGNPAPQPPPVNPDPVPQPPPVNPEEEPVEEEEEAPQPPSQQDRDFNDRFRKWKDVKEFLGERGLIDQPGDRLSLEDYNAIRDEFLRQGVSPEAFDKSAFATKHKPIALLPVREQAMMGMKGLKKKNVAWEKKSTKMFEENPDVEALVAKKMRKEPVTQEEELKIQQTMVKYGIIKSIRMRNPEGNVPPTEEAETPAEEEAEQPQLPSVTENDFIRPEVASQFRDARNIESINEGIAAIQSLNRDERASGYNDILYGLGTELGNDALFSEEYQNLMQTAFMDGSSRAIQLMSDQAQDPKDKLKILMAGRMTSPKSNESAKMLADFIAKYGKDYDVNAINTIINDVGAKAMQAQSDEGRAKIINTFLDNDLDPNLFNHREGGKKDDTPVDEEVADPEQFAGDVVDQLDPSLFRQEEEEGEGGEEEIPLDEAEGQIDVSDLPQEFQNHLNNPVERLPDGTVKWGDLYNFYINNSDYDNADILSEDQDDRYSRAFVKKVYDNLGDDPKGTVDSLINWINEFSYGDSQFKDLDDMIRIWDVMMNDLFRGEDEPAQYDKLSPWDQGLYYTLSEALAHANDYDDSNIVPVGDDDPQLQLEYLAQILGTMEPEFRDQGLWEKMGGRPEEPEEPEAEAPVDPNSTDAFEQDAGPGRGLVFSKDSQYKDFKSMAEAMGKELGISQHSKVETTRDAIDTWLSKNKIGYAKGIDADALKDEITKYLRKNDLIPSTKDKSGKGKGKREDSNLEDMKSILSEGPAADKDSIKKDKRKVDDFKKRIKKKYAGRKEDTDRVLKLFNEFMKDYESNMKEQYVNHGDMAWRAQAISDFLKWDQISTADRNILTPKTKTKKNKTGDPTEGNLNTEPLDEAPEYDPAKRDEFMNEMNDFSKYGSGSRLAGAYIATLNAHNKALDNIQGAIDDLDKEIAAKEKIRGQQGWTIEDEDNLDKLYNMKGVLKYNMSSWKKSKEAHEYYDKFSGVYDAFNKASDKAEHGEPLDTGELEAVEAGISTLSDEDQNLFAPLMDHLRAKAAKSDREQNINEYAKLQAELNKLKNDAEGLKKERELDEVRSSLNDMLEGFESGTLEMSKELDKNFSEFVKKLPAKERDSFNKKLEGLKKKATFKKIREKGGFADESDPTKWLKEISECTDESTLAKKVNAYEMYIATQQENAQKGLYRSLERAKDKADQLINSSGERLAAKLIKNIQEHGYHAFDVDKDEYESRILGGATSDDEMAKAKELWEKVMEARDISKTLEDSFGVSYSDFIEDARSDGVQNDMWKVLSNKVKEAYRNGDEGSGLAQEYRLLIKKMKLNPAEADLANKLLEAAIPKKNTTKSLSIRDLFRARNADWE